MAKVAERAGGAVAVDVPSQLEPGLENDYDFLHFTPAGAARVAEIVASQVP